MTNGVYVVVRQKPTEHFRAAIRKDREFLPKLRADSDAELRKAGGESILRLGMHSDGGLFVMKFPSLDAWHTYTDAVWGPNGHNHADLFTRTVEFGFPRD
jgi:hypothetical protein